jgi:hypothetical protein
MKNRHFTLPLLLLPALLLLQTNQAAFADSGTWLANPISNDWNTAANWSSGTVPAGANDIATFALSNIADVSVSAFLGVSGITFDSGADAYTITPLPGTTLEILGVGILNLSGVMQNFVSPVSGGSSGNYVFFGKGVSGPTITGSVTFTQEARNADTGDTGFVQFQIGALAGDATFHNLGATVAGGVGGRTDFFDSHKSADESTMINEGTTVSGAIGGASYLLGKSAIAGETIANAAPMEAAVTYFPG